MVTGDGERSMQLIDPKGSFLKNLILSLVLLGVSSLLVPAVLKQIDDRKAIDQQKFQEQLSRQDKILDAQAALLDTMASDFWQYELYASDVVISRDERFGQDDWHRRAVDAYYQQTGPLLGKMRGEISTLLRLAPQSKLQKPRRNPTLPQPKRLPSMPTSTSRGKVSSSRKNGWGNRSPLTAS